MTTQRQSFGGKRFQLRLPTPHKDNDSTGKRMIWKECKAELIRHWFYLLLIGLFLLAIFILPPSTSMNTGGGAATSQKNSLLRTSTPYRTKQHDELLTKEQELNFNKVNTLDQVDNKQELGQNGKRINDNISDNEPHLDGHITNQKEEENAMEVLLGYLKNDRTQGVQTNQRNNANINDMSKNENKSFNNNIVTNSNRNNNQVDNRAELTPVVPDINEAQASSPRCTTSFVADTTLKVINVKGCGFQSLPSNLCQLVPNLQELDISFNPGILWEDAGLHLCPNLLVLKANGIIARNEAPLQQYQNELPPTISNLLTLTHLEWRFNGLTYINISSLPFNLEYAAFSFNQITTIQQASNDNKNSSPTPPLHTLLLSHNQITNLEWIAEFKELRTLRLAHNNFVFDENDESYETKWSLFQQYLPNLAWISLPMNSFLTKKKATKTMVQIEESPTYLSLPVLVPTIGSTQLAPAPHTDEYHFFQGKPVQVKILDSQSSLYQFFNIDPKDSNNNNNGNSNYQNNDSISLHIDGLSIQEELKIHAAIGMHGTIHHHHVRGCMAILSKDGVVFPASIPTQEENYVSLSFVPILDYFHGSYSLTIQQAWSVLQQVAIALTFLHTDVGIIYGNLCLENIMLVQTHQLEQKQPEMNVVLAGSMEYAFPFPKENNPVLEQIEVRSFGHFIEDLLQYVQPLSDSANEQVEQQQQHEQQQWKQPFQQLQNDCFNSNMSSFLQILNEYFGLNDNNSITISTTISNNNNNDEGREIGMNKGGLDEQLANNNNNNNIIKPTGFNQNDISSVVQNMNNQAPPPQQQQQQ